MAKLGRPKGERDADAKVFVRLTSAELDTLRAAVAKELEGIAGATPSVPRFMLAAALDRARKILGRDK